MIQIYSKHKIMDPLFESANKFYVKREYLYFTTSGLNKYFGKIQVFLGKF